MTADLIGTWTLLHCKLFNTKGEELFDPFHNASGLIMYDTNGTVAAQIMRHGHANAIKGNLFNVSIESFKSSFENYLAYYGRYSVDETKKIVTHHVIGALWPNMVNTSLARRYEFKDADTIVLSNVEPEAIVTAEPITRYLTWSRTTQKDH